MEEIKVFYSEDKAEQEGETITKRLRKLYPEQEGKFSKEQYDEVERQIYEEQIKLIKEMSLLKIPTYLVGGYASDLLILEIDGSFEGDFVDPHTDIDMLINAKDSEALTDKLKELGFKVKKRVEPGQEKANKIYISNTHSIEADFALLETDEESGEPYFNTKSGDKNCKMYLSRDVLDGPVITLGDTLVKVLSPRGLIQSLLFYRQLGISELREKDKIRAERLREKYFPDETLDSDLFKVRIEES
jgi:hypothetical protein